MTGELPVGPAMARLLRQAERLAEGDSWLLLQGETGSGGEAAVPVSVRLLAATHRDLVAERCPPGAGARSGHWLPRPELIPG